MKSDKALVIFSGGQDSTTCLGIALKQHQAVHTITFDYGQRHRIELEAASKIVTLLPVVSHTVLPIHNIFDCESPLVSENPVRRYESVEKLPGGVENTFVPGRNILFLCLAAIRAVRLEITDIYIGVCQADFGGYWDCREEFIRAMNAALGLGMSGVGSHFTIHTPLLNATKKEAVLLAHRSLGDDFETVFSNTHTCYEGIRGGCGECHACLLRDRGFHEAEIPDPLWKLRAKSPAN